MPYFVEGKDEKKAAYGQVDARARGCMNTQRGLCGLTKVRNRKILSTHDFHR